MGSIYKRGNLWWIKYRKNGTIYRESSGTDKKMVATTLLEIREGEIAQGKLPGIHFEKVTFDQLAEDFLRDYRINQKKSLVRAEGSVNHLKKFFEGTKAADISTPMVQHYVEGRIKEGAANATINRELAALKRMLNLGAKQTPPLVGRVPHIPMLKENNVRKGFFENSQFLALRDALPPYLRDFATFGYRTGWRASEASQLTWDRVDRTEGIVRLEVGETKNNEGRTIYLDDELKQIIAMQWENRRRSGRICPYVFPNEQGTGPIGDFRKAWNSACRKIKIGYGYKTSRKYILKWRDKLPDGPLLHDFRRSAVRNHIRAGVSENVARKISGHKTLSVFYRYDIVNEEDLKLASQKQQAYLESQTGTISGTVSDFATKKGASDDC